MFNNIGKKLKGLAVFCTVAGAISSIIYGISLMFLDNGLLGFLLIILGSLGSWLASLPLYGVGELNDDNASYYEKTIIEKLNELIKQIEQREELTANRLHELEKQVGELTKAVRTEKTAVRETEGASEPIPEGMWRCGRCGSLNEDGLTSCKYCGTEK